MNPYPQDNSILIMDNCAIHKSDALRDIVEAHSLYFFLLTPSISTPLKKVSAAVSPDIIYHEVELTSL
jgi:hypothetical protein